LCEINEKIRDVGSLIGEITASSEEQANAIQDTTSMLNDVDKYINEMVVIKEHVSNCSAKLREEILSISNITNTLGFTKEDEKLVDLDDNNVFSNEDQTIQDSSKDFETLFVTSNEIEKDEDFSRHNSTTEFRIDSDVSIEDENNITDVDAEKILPLDGTEGF